MTLLADTAALPPSFYLRESVAIVRAQDPAVAQRPTIVSGRLTLSADRVTFDTETGMTHFYGSVLAEYEGTRLISSEAEIDTDAQTGHFRTGVRLTDELGVLTAQELFLDWSRHEERVVTGYAKNIVLDAYEAHFEGDELILEADQTVRLKKAWFSTAAVHYKIHVEDVVIKPGQFISARRATLELGNKTRIPIPFFRVNLNPRVTGLQMPVPSVDGDFRIGYTWGQVLELGNRATLHLAHEGGFKKTPSVNAQLTYEVRPEVGPAHTVIPRSEDRERFTDGYFDDVRVPSLQAEWDEVSRKQFLLFVGHTTNIDTDARPSEAIRLDRRYYAGLQASGQIMGMAGVAQLRYGNVKERLAKTDLDRFELTATGLLREVVLGDRWSLRFRADTGSYAGDGTSYGWIRPMVSIIAKPAKEAVVGISYFRALEWGTPAFDADRLYSENGVHFRADLDFAATDLSLLLKYDVDRSRLYDFEFSITQVMPVITGFLTYRHFPRTISVGASIRADRLFEALRRREIIRDRSN